MNLAKQASMVMLRQSTLVLQNKVLSRIYLHGGDLLVSIAVGEVSRIDISRNVVLMSKDRLGIRHRDLGTRESSRPIHPLKVNWRP